MTNPIIKAALRIGLTNKLPSGGYSNPFFIAPWWMWRMALRRPIAVAKLTGGIYVFRTLPGYVKWRQGRLLPWRWGFGIMGLIEFGDRGH